MQPPMLDGSRAQLIQINAAPVPSDGTFRWPGRDKIVSSLTTGRSALLALLMLVAGSAHAEDDCDVPVAKWQPRSAVKALAQKNNWRIDHLKIDDGCYEIKGRDEEGMRFKVMLNPATLDVVRMKRERERRRDRLREMPPESQSQNPLEPGEDG